MTDLLIVGQGFAGLFAAVLAAQRGARTTLIAAGRGGLSLSHGCIDVRRGGASPNDLRALPADHPYRIADPAGLQDALAAFHVISAKAGLVYRGALGDDLRLTTALGGIHTTCLAPDSLARGRLEDTLPTTIGEIEGYRDFSAELAVRNLARAGIGVVRSVSLPLIGEAPRRDLYAHDLALRFDDPDWRTELARAWKPRLGGVRRLGVPAVLGLRHHPDVIASLEERLDLRLFEIPTLPPNVPGLRLERVLRQSAHAAGVRLIEGARAVGLIDGRRGGRRVSGVVAHSAGGPRSYPSPAVLLATGGVLHGGLIARQNGRVQESVFDLPITDPGARGRLTSESVFGSQPFARLGLRVDRRMRPMSESGGPFFENLYAAGGVLAGSDRTIEGTRQGIDILTALRAVECALGDGSA